MDLFYQDLKELMNKKEKGGYILCPCCLGFAPNDAFVLIEPMEYHHNLYISEDGDVVLGKSELFREEAPCLLFHFDGCGEAIELDAPNMDAAKEALIVFLPERKRLIIGQKAETVYDEETIKNVKKAARRAGVIVDMVEVL